jgi:polysaccharide transporter, PST family
LTVPNGRLPPAPDGLPAGLEGRVARGLSWTMLDVWGREGLNFLVFLVLANLLLPVDFGLMALASVFVALAQVLADAGLEEALIQRPQLTARQTATAFWTAVTLGLVLTVLLVALAGPISTALGEPRLGSILQVLALTFVLSSLSSVQIGLLRRRLAFKSLAVRSVSSAAVGGLTGVALALSGFGVWALVGMQLLFAATSVVVLWLALPWRPSLQLSVLDFRSLLAFGARVVGSDLMTFLSRNADNFLIGVALGPTVLGLYAVAYRILDATQALLVNVARKVAFPALSTLQDEPDRLRRAYLRLSRTAAVAVLPAYLGMALVAPELIVLLFGQRWAASGPIATVLFLSGPALTLQAFSISLLYATGHPDVYFRFRIVTTVTTVLAFVIAVPFGVLAVAGAFALSGYLVLPLILRWLERYGGVPQMEALSALAGVFAASAVMSVVVLAVKLIARPSVSPLPLLVSEVAAGSLTFAVAMRVFDPQLLHEALSAALHVLPLGESPRRWLDGRLGPPLRADGESAGEGEPGGG